MPTPVAAASIKESIKEGPVPALMPSVSAPHGDGAVDIIRMMRVSCHFRTDKIIMNLSLPTRFGQGETARPPHKIRALLPK